MNEQKSDSMLHYLTIQYALKSGLKKFGQVGEAEVQKELSQLHMLNNFKHSEAD